MSLLSRLAVEASRAYGFLTGRSTNVSASYLVIAGGGSGGVTSNAGGGGAGGYRNSVAGETSGGGSSAESPAILSTLVSYTIIIGAGGASVSTTTTNGNQGNNSSISGTGLTTITSIGGGYGGAPANIGGTGGSGGGSGYSYTAAGGAATANQGYGGGKGSGSAPPAYSGGGGGGAGTAGGSGTSSLGSGIGGNGLSSSITGSAVTRAGGGGGDNDTSTVQAGGSGGGGAGGSTATINGVAGTVNTGSGGGAGYTSGTSGAGGSGIVIISYASATPKFVGGTITTSGGNQIHTFTSSGTLTPLTPVTASYLVVAGGGAGSAGGGGAGGLLTGSTTLYSPATYIVTVGAGGTAGQNTTAGTSGSNSVLSGTGLTTITSTGGGRGGIFSNASLNNGVSGGSGGGGGNSDTGFPAGTGASGTSGQGNSGGNGTSLNTVGAAGGGGGAGAAGGNGVSSSNGGAGGVGLTSSISGSSVYYAGGGSGGGSIATAGGQGGGGTGGASSSAGSPGTANTGGGGGGGGNTSVVASGAGGSGIVIISYAGSQVFNGGTVTTSGGNTIHTFYATGALTPITNNLTNSLRFRSSATAYLSRTFSTPTNNKIFTYSVWVKRGALGNNYGLFSPTSSGTGYTTFRFESDDTINFQEYTGSAYNYQLDTTQVFRDPSAWYHLVVAVDTTQATAANRIKLYVNGNQVTAFATASYPTQNSNPFFNSAVGHNVGANIYSGSREQYFDGYMADIYFIDGQALEPYYFGSNDSNNVWKPIKYYGTYGTNGFYLTFGNTTSTTTLGYDSSPNGNNWTTNNISLTAGTTYDAMTDVPTLTSATAANYCVLNPVNQSSNTIVDGNLKTSFSAVGGNRSTIGMSSGKWYWEVSPTTCPSFTLIGIASASVAITGDVSATNCITYMSQTGYWWRNNVGTAYGATYTTTDVIGIAVDVDNNTITFYKNGVSQGAITSVTLTGDTWFATMGNAAASATVGIYNFGQRPFSYTPPTGFVALNTYNLPTSTIVQGNKYMDATLYTGTGTSQVIVNQAQFKPDFVWGKSRSTAGTNNVLEDSVRGASVWLASDLTDNESTLGTGPITSFNSNGFSVGTGLSGSTRTYVAWQWQAGQGSTSSNTSGSITSTVSVNTTAGFSVVTWAGNSTNGATIGHGLGVAPKLLITKSRTNATSWTVGIGNISGFSVNDYLSLNNTDAKSSSSTFYQAYGANTFTVGVSAANEMNKTGNNYVTYCWAEIAGFSKFGSWTGNANASGPFIYTGFQPKFIMFKRTDAIENWGIWTPLAGGNGIGSSNNFYLLPNTSGAQDTTQIIDILSNGFKIRDSGSFDNANNGTYIYAAFASNPFKNSNAF